MKAIPPCGKCERKGCGAYHDKCEKYKEYREKINKEKEGELKELPKHLMPVVPISKANKRRRREK